MSGTLINPPLKTRLEEKDIGFLTQSGPSLKLSLYLPFDPAWRDADGGKTLLRDLRRKAAHALEAHGALSGGIEAILAPVEALLADKQAYRLAGKGLALFSDGEASLGVLLPATPVAKAEIDLHFRIDGIFTQIYGRDRFYLLSLSQHEIMLWDCDGVGMRALSLDGLETDIRKTPHFEEAEFQAMVHSTGASGHGHSSAYAGIGSADGKRMKRRSRSSFEPLISVSAPGSASADSPWCWRG